MNLKTWLRDLLRAKSPDLRTVRDLPDRDRVDNMIGTIVGNIMSDEKKSVLTNLNLNDNEGKNSESTPDTVPDFGSAAPSASTPQEEKTNEGSESDSRTDGESEPEGCCPYGVKRNIVNSIREIERFAREHEVAASILRIILTRIAELVLNALKGKVGAGTLLMILNAMNFDKAREEAFREGELSGRNARIEETYFPKTDDGLPHFKGTARRSRPFGDIFDTAREA